jgi:outer membrane protein
MTVARVFSARLIALAFLAGSLLAAPPPVRAQSSSAESDTTTITFSEAVRTALRQNATLKQKANAARIEEIGVSQARSAFYPSLSMSLGGTQRYGRTFSQQEGGIVSETNETVEGGARASVNLFNGFGDVAGYRQAEHQAEASEQSYQRARQTVVFNVMSEFLTLIRRREQVQVQKENLAALRQQLQQVREFVEVGTRPRSDLYQQQAEVAQAELDLLNARQQYDLGRTQLIETLQLDPFGAYGFQAPAVADSVESPARYDLAALLRRAYQKRPDLAADRAEIEAAGEGLEVAEAGYWPSLDLSANYGSNWSSAARQPIPGTGTEPELVTVQPVGGGEPIQLPRPGTGADPAFRRVSVGDQLDQRRGGSVSLSISYPLFDRFRTRHRVEQARVQRENARLALQDRRQQVAVQVRRAYQNYETARKRLSVTRQQVRAAEQALRAAEQRYELGAATIVELSQARSRFVQAQSDRVEARYDYFFQQNLLKYYTGTLDPSASLFE